jgi:predicted small lipoprotein YifL
MLRKAALILVAGLLAVLSACGQKGPLQVPGVPVGAPWPYADPPRKAPPPPPKVPDLPGTTDERK